MMKLPDPWQERMCQTGDSNGGFWRILVFWDTTPCTLVYRERSFGVYCTYLQGRLHGQKCSYLREERRQYSRPRIVCQLPHGRTSGPTCLPRITDDSQLEYTN